MHGVIMKLYILALATWKMVTSVAKICWWSQWN